MAEENISLDQLVGKDSTHLVAVQSAYLHEAVVNDWLAMCEAASAQGFELAIASAYRSFARQLKIWNDKATGVRPIVDDSGQVLNIENLEDKAIVFAILRWSALPGGSRHHWGSEIDVYDNAAMPENYQLQLSDAEVGKGGLFAALHDWLDCYIDNDGASFYRPYQGETHVAAERWHLSHRPTSQHFAECLTAELLYKTLAAESELQLRDAVLANFDEIFSGYVRC